VLQEVRPGALPPAGSTVLAQDSPAPSGGHGGTIVRLYDMVSPQRSPNAANGTPPTVPAGYWEPRLGSEEGRMPERGGYCPASAPVVRGRRRQAGGRASPEATDVRGAGGAGGGATEQNWKDGIKAFGGDTWLYRRRATHLRGPDSSLGGGSEGAGGECSGTWG